MRRIFTIALCLARSGLTCLAISAARMLPEKSLPAEVVEDPSKSADIEYLRSELKSPDPNVRATAVEQLSGMGLHADGAIPQLVELLGDRAPAKSGGSTI